MRVLLAAIIAVIMGACASIGRIEGGPRDETPPVFVRGIEKVIPTQADLPLFLRLLSRSSLGYDITQYTSHISAPAPGQEIHVVMLDNGRSERLGQPYWEVLKCMRCGTCMNTCPVFRRTSGISYDANYMGPLGLALRP